MRLVSNRVEPNQVEETAEAYIIKDVPFLKPMHLSGGYVPRANVKETAEAWHGVPATLNHTRNEQGKPIPAERKPNRHIGSVRSPSFEGEFVEAGQLRINKAALDQLGSEADQVQSALENGDPLEVSSQYMPQQLPAGEYDGEYRANVEKIVRPDSVAILPGQKGQCSIEDGCGIKPELVANAKVSIPMTQNAKHGEEMDAAASDFSDGDVVKWQSSGGQAMGVIRDTISEGDYDGAIDGDVVVEAPAALIEIVEETDDGLEPTGTMVAHKTNNDTLSMVENPPEVTANQEIPYEVTNVAPGEVEFTDSEWNGSDAEAGFPNPSDNEDAPDTLDQVYAAVPADDEARDAKSNWKLPFRTGPDAPVNTRALVAIDSVLSGGRGGVEGISESVQSDISDWVQSMLDEAPDENFGADMESNSLTDIVVNAVANVRSKLTTEAKSSTEPTDQSTSNMDRETKIEFITANSALSETALTERCDDGLDAIYDDVEANSETNTDADGDDSTVTDNNETVVELSESELDDLIAEKAEEIVANREEQSEKDELAQEIVANSAEYEDTESVTEDYPTVEALKTKKQTLETGSSLPDMGVSANDLGDEIDVSAGILGGDD
jgi:hypothetical protein